MFYMSKVFFDVNTVKLSGYVSSVSKLMKSKSNKLFAYLTVKTSGKKAHYAEVVAWNKLAKQAVSMKKNYKVIVKAHVSKYGLVANSVQSRKQGVRGKNGLTAKISGNIARLYTGCNQNTGFAFGYMTIDTHTGKRTTSVEVPLSAKNVKAAKHMHVGEKVDMHADVLTRFSKKHADKLVYLPTSIKPVHFAKKAA